MHCSLNRKRIKMNIIKLNILCIFLVLLSLSCSKKEEKAAAPPPPDVTVFQTEAREVPIYREFVGQVFGFKDIAIRARVEGYLEGIHFEEGSRIKKGTLLYTIESQQFEANVAEKMSKVAEAQTMLANAVSELNRIRPLAEQKAVSASDLDSAVARHDASVASLEAAEANLRAAKIQLSYTKIYSPIAGVIGKTQAKVGDFVGREPNPVILNTVSQINTVLVQFFITETEYLLVARRYLAQTKPAKPEDREASLELILANGSLYEHKGRPDFIDREVDPTTGAMLVQASFPNPDEILRPGQFAKVKARVENVSNAILIPQRCVTELQGQFSVFVVDDNNTVHKRQVKTGPTINQFWLITEGLKSGERIVYEGLQKVREGVVVNPTVKQIELPSEEGN
jgi:membrane fusion protein (multidrug efflux system)